MTSDSHAHALDELAVALGVTRAYHDGMGQWRCASDEAVMAVVRALGAPLERMEDAGDALHFLRARTAAARAQA
ncbi:MAG: hypothetical protein ABR587_06555, partial [Candidatus Binatia bacterium]